MSRADTEHHFLRRDFLRVEAITQRPRRRRTMAPAFGRREHCGGRPARVLAGSDSRSPQGSIRGSNLHETQHNSEHLDRLGMRKSNWTAPPDTSSASGWGREGRWFESSRPDLSPANRGIYCCTHPQSGSQMMTVPHPRHFRVHANGEARDPARRCLLVVSRSPASRLAQWNPSPSLLHSRVMRLMPTGSMYL
jgi:hypothetical protein